MLGIAVTAAGRVETFDKRALRLTWDLNRVQERNNGAERGRLNKYLNDKQF